MMGAVASVMAGFIVAFLLDLRHPVIRSASQMEREVGIPPVVSIPVLELPKEKSGGYRARLKASRALRE